MLKDNGFDKNSRINTDDYFLKIASVVAERSTCKRHKVGAIAVRDKKIITTGYNGAAAGTKDCLELGCLRDQLGIESGTKHEVCRAIHAEQNVIIQGALHGSNLEGSTIYSTLAPCILCAKMLVNAKIKRFVTYSEYSEDNFLKLFGEAGIQFDKMGKPSDRIFSD
ncbi:MAG: dCMP deaminase family protein [Nanoarchaeota archaeon]|nr:dCMP deaminase family protein [Nanoarchaeota archaeon]